MQTAAGKVPIAVSSSTTVNTTAAPLATNSYAVLVGSVNSSTGGTATYVALFRSAPPAASISGTVTGATPFGIDVKSSSAGVVPVLISSSTSVSGSIANGATVNVSGIGSTGSGIYAQRITSSSPVTNTTPATTPASTTSGVPQHLLTGDYLGSPFGTTAVSASSAAPHLTWAQTGVGNAAAMHAAGIKTELYTNPNRVQTNDPMYALTAASGYASTCGASRVYVTFNGITQYVMNPGQTATQQSYKLSVDRAIGTAPIDALFEDNVGPLSTYGTSSFKAAMPCNYSDSSWTAGEKALEASVGRPTIFNGLSVLNGHNPSQSIALLSNSSTIGATYEHCLSDSAARPAAYAWVWQATENTQIQVVGQHKLFFCMGRNTTAASSSQVNRIYMLASFLMTYDPQYSVLWEEFGTPNGFHVLPESRFVALNPVIAQPSNVSSLLTSGGTYVREYNSCYYGGQLVGRCAMVVNSDYYTHTRPALSAYHHSLVLSGNDVLEGGSASFSGALPSTTMASGTAAILLP